MEIWKEIKGYEGHFEISSSGLVRSLDRLVPSKRAYQKGLRVHHSILIKIHVGKRGYATVRISKNKQPKTFSIHRLLALAFIDNPLNYPYINHKDGNKLNNNLENLEWCTAKQNTNHAFSIGLYADRHFRPNRRLRRITFEQANEIRIRYRSGGVSQSALAREYGIDQQAVHTIIQNKIYVNP